MLACTDGFATPTVEVEVAVEVWVVRPVEVSVTVAPFVVFVLVIFLVVVFVWVAINTFTAGAAFVAAPEDDEVISSTVSSIGSQVFGG